MSETLLLLLKIYVGTLVLNIFISLIQIRESRGGAVQKSTLVMWLAIAVQFVIAGIFQEVNFITVCFYSVTFFQSMAICQLATLTMGIQIDRRLSYWVFGLSWIPTLIFEWKRLHFTWLSTPFTIAIVVPLFLLFWAGVKKGTWSKLSFVQRAFLVTALLLGCHFLDYPFLRPNPGTAIFGASVLYALVHVLSILVPMMANEVEYKRYSSKLEEEVENQRAQNVQNAKMAALGEMAGGVAHEINTPLAIIQLNSEQLLEIVSDERIDRGLVEERVQSVLETVKRIAKIVLGLRTFSRNGSGDPMQREKVTDIVEATMGLCQEKFRGDGVDLSVWNSDPSLAIHGRGVEVSQVLLNLLSNARDAVAHSDKKWVRLEVRKMADSVEISVTDSGPGVPAKLRDKIFQPFFTTKDVGKGTGLGLSVSESIIKAHSGTLKLDQNAQNTRFVVVLPRIA